MASHARLLLEELLTALRQEHEHFDLSTVDGTHRVVVDEAEAPVLSGPWVTLSAPHPTVDHSAYTPLTEYQIRGTLEFWAFAPSEEESPEARAFAALDLAHDVVKALQVAHTQVETYPNLGACSLLLPVGPVEVYGDASVAGIAYGLAKGTIAYEVLVDGGL